MTARGAGSLRERGAGRWEVRVSLGPDPVSGLAVYRSVTVRGELADAQGRRALLAAQAEQLRARRPGQPLDPWLFCAAPDHQQRLNAGTLGHWFTAFVRRHGNGDVSLHRLRHTVATVLVSQGQLLQAQQRLRHAEASTTLRQYCHALPLHDLDVADRLEQLLGD